MVKEVLLINKQRKLCLEMESTFGEDAVNNVEITTENLECQINLVYIGPESEKIDSNFEKFIVG